MMFALKIMDINRTIQLLRSSQVIPPLLSKDQLPPDLQEIAILGGYRHPKSTVFECAISVFLATNETLNFWTHFLPVWYFVWKFLTESSVTYEDINNSYHWPFITYMVTVCFYPLVSALAHAFHCTSSLARHIWFFLDYSALSMYSLGSAILYKAYVFPGDLRQTFFADIYLYVALSNSICCTLSACISRFTRSHSLKKVLRMGAFGVPYFWTATPLIYKIIFCSLKTDGLCSVESRIHYIQQFLFCFLAAFMYASHLPERLAPGMFDIIGHSHQFLHVCSVLATNEQMNGAILDHGNGTREFLTVNVSVGLPLLLVFVNLIIIFSFSRYAAQKISAKED